MRILNTINYLALATMLFACDKHPASGVDPMLGVECYENHRASFTPGVQYEGIEKLAEDKLTIRIMNGVEVVTLDCELNPDGTLRSTAK